ncbi:MAG: hypothetical protein VZR09_10135 [Candidatus Gastranaerophilaceae bacterium]|nr:hypothetical protein [Candidatus Gastranaerophilaceae bacterium]
MNIQPVNFEFTRKRRLKSECDNPGVMHPNSKLRYSVQDCDLEKDTDNRGYNVNFSGSLPNESGAAAKTLMEKIMSSGVFQWLTGFSGAHNVAAAALIGLFLAGGLRPAITISLPGKKDLEDKIYAAGHSMASGLIGFGFSTLITTPIDSGVKFIYEDSKNISIENYNQLTKEELAEYIRKNNLNPEDIASKMKNDKLSEEYIISKLKDSEGKNLKSNEMAAFVKDNNGVIMPIRKLYKEVIKKDKDGKKIVVKKYQGLNFIAEHVDKIHELQHQLHLETDMVKKGKLLGEIRNLENWVKGAETTMKNVSEWAIAIPRAMLTIALIPPILKYVFHVEKKKTAAPEPKQVEVTAAATVTPEEKEVQPMKLSMNKFMGGAK